MGKMSDKKQPKKSADKQSLFQKVSLGVYKHYKIASVMFAILVILGGLSYTTFLKKEGFPAIQVPITITNGTYFVNDAEQVDQEVAIPVSEALKDVEGVTQVQSFSGPNFFTVVTQFEESTSSEAGAEAVEDAISALDLPDEVESSTPPIDVGLFLNEYNILLSVYDSSSNRPDLKLLEEKAALVASEISQNETVENAEVIESFSQGINPQTGQQQEIQTGFSRIGFIDSEDPTINRSVLVGVKSTEGTDVIAFSETVNSLVTEIENSSEFDGVEVEVSVDFAPNILTQIDSLEGNLLTGLIAVSLVSLLLITWRASVVTALFMISVVASTLAVMWAIGYSLNTITLFSLVLSLGLFVDDATIIVEAIDAGKANKLKGSKAVRDAIGRVAAPSFAGTFTTVLVFLPLVFISGILGSFIRVMPVTIIIALITSFVLSITLIPLLSKYFLLNNSKKSWSPLGGIVSWLARNIGGLPLIFRRSRLLGWVVTTSMIGVSLIFFIAAMYFAGQVTFNIFPPSKDSNQIQLAVNFPENTQISEAEEIADDVVDFFLGTIDNSLVESVVFLDGNERSAQLFVELVPFTERDTKAPSILETSQAAFDADFERANVQLSQTDAGPPVGQFPFKAQIYTEDPQEARVLATKMVELLDGAEVERLNGTTANIDSTNLANFDSIARIDGERVFEVQAGFDADDTTALVEATQTLVEDAFEPGGELADLSLSLEDVEFNFGQESDNQESFASLPIVGLVAFVAMFVLLSIQFRSLLKPLLIFLAIPFSLLGVFLGLYLTDNSLSFFVMIGLFGLIGIAVNNTILLTDYANQERKAGNPIIESIAAATEKRFRPLLATSITTVVALLPLALSDPFWEALAFTIIFGLLSSTFLVIVSFPYYYLLVEGLRVKTAKVARRVFKRA